MKPKVLCSSQHLFHFTHALGRLILLALTLAMFWKFLWAFDGQVVGNQHSDLFNQFIAWRQFGFSEMAKGNIALWNPHIFGGAPYFGGFQAALLYPLNWIFLIAPVSVAINWSIALHVLLLGLFMQWWMARRGLHPAAACLSGALIMFGGTYFPHIYAGHLTNLCAMVWAPLVFLVIDEVIGLSLRPAQEQTTQHQLLGWSSFGCVVVALQILAGHPQYVFYTGIASALYVGAEFFRTRFGLRALGYLLIIPVGALALSAVQIFAGWDAAALSIRGRPLPFAFASMFSLPFENLITVIAPGVLGRLSPHEYFGRGYLWEMSIFMGVTGAFLATVGTLTSQPLSASNKRGVWIILALTMLVLALGVNTPLFAVLYTYIPGFDKFRGVSKFIFPASLFLTALAGLGFHYLLTCPVVSKRIAISAFLAGASLYGVAVSLRYLDWLPVLHWISSTGESYLLAKVFLTDSIADQQETLAAFARSTATQSLLIAGSTFILLAGFLVSARRHRAWVGAVWLLAMAEVFTFAISSREGFDSVIARAPEVGKNLRQGDNDYRIFNANNPNSAMLSGQREVGGNDPGVLQRYAEFLAFVRGQNPDNADQYLDFREYHRLYGMLGLRLAFIWGANREINIVKAPTPQHRLWFVRHFQLAKSRDAVFSAMSSSAFEPSDTAILESTPVPEPEGNTLATARILAESTDSLTIEAETAAPSLLVISENYATGWVAKALPGSAQTAYDVLPANYILRAVPLQTGKHRILMEYSPPRVRFGAWVSGVAVIFWMGFAGWWLRRQQALAR